MLAPLVRSGELGAKCGNPAVQAGALPARTHPMVPSEAAGAKQESRSPGGFVVIRQVQDQVETRIRRSGSGLVRFIRVRCSPVITEQVCSHVAGLRPSEEVTPWVRFWINRVHDRTQA